MDLRNVIKVSGKTLKQHAPEILMGAGVAGLLVSIPLTFRAALAVDEISRETTGVGIKEGISTMDRKDAIKLFGPALLPVALTATLSASAVVGSSVLSTKRAAVLAGAYAVSDRVFEEYRAAVTRKIGEESEREVREDVAVERLRKAPLSENVITLTGHGDTLCFDSMSGRYFRSDVESIRKAQNDLNNELFHDTFVSLNRLYDYMGLDHIRLGEELGWTTDDLVELTFSSQLTPENAPCVVVNYLVEPKFDQYRSI